MLSAELLSVVLSVLLPVSAAEEDVTFPAELLPDAKVFISGRVSAEEDKASKLVCDRIWPFEEVSRQVWIQFETKEAYSRREKEIMDLIRDSDGRDELTIYIKKPRAVKHLGARMSFCADEKMVAEMRAVFGAENVKVV